MPELAYMPFYTDDWLLDTDDLTPDAYTAYHRLLCHMWRSRLNGLPMDHKTLANRAGFSSQKWPHVWKQIEHFFYVSDGLVGQQKLDKVRGKARSSYELRSAAGIKGAKSRWLKSKGKGGGKANGSANGEANNNQNQTSINTRESHFDLEKKERPISEVQEQAIKDGKDYLVQGITPSQARAAIDAKLVTEEECDGANVKY